MRISETAVKKRLTSVMRRAGAGNRTALVRVAFVSGVFASDESKSWSTLSRPDSEAGSLDAEDSHRSFSQGAVRDQSSALDALAQGHG